MTLLKKVLRRGVEALELKPKFRHIIFLQFARVAPNFITVLRRVLAE